MSYPVHLLEILPTQEKKNFFCSEFLPHSANHQHFEADISISNSQSRCVTHIDTQSSIFNQPIISSWGINTVILLYQKQVDVWLSMSEGLKNQYKDKRLSIIQTTILILFLFVFSHFSLFFLQDSFYWSFAREKKKRDSTTLFSCGWQWKK